MSPQPDLARALAYFRAHAAELREAGGGPVYGVRFGDDESPEVRALARLIAAAREEGRREERERCARIAQNDEAESIRSGAHMWSGGPATARRIADAIRAASGGGDGTERVEREFESALDPRAREAAGSPTATPPLPASEGRKP